MSKAHSKLSLLKKPDLSLSGVGRAAAFYLLKTSSVISILITLGICAVIALESEHFLEAISIREFLFGTEWSPLIEPRKFGVLPIVWGSLLIAGLAVIFAVPLGVLLAIYLSEYAPLKVKKVLKPLIEILAGIPSIVFGYLAVTVVTPVLMHFLPETQFFNALSAAIVVTAMVLPSVVSLSDDAIGAVPDDVRKAGFALGATKSEVTLHQILPAALSGIVASVILAFSRAIGETMAVTLAAGATPNLTINLLDSVQTMTAFIVQASMGDTPHGTIEYYSLFAVAGLLFLITLVLNVGSRYITRNVRRKFA